MNNMISALNQKIYAVVGASENKDKFGYKVFKFLKDRGLETYPINPKIEMLDGVKCYSKLEEVDKAIDVVVTVVPPKIAKQVVEQSAKLGIKYVWMQPGSNFETAEEYCDELGINAIVDECIMVEMKK
ncbi:CoA-binding protein [Orenia marismortui]|uniref:CoA-binding protein n=1 Tax=Orenia marismortui TaxID=46469 RepID=UPI000371C5EB|nr:CoA-binding protein [Orenia marismortui]